MRVPGHAAYVFEQQRCPNQGRVLRVRARAREGPTRLEGNPLPLRIVMAVGACPRPEVANAHHFPRVGARAREAPTRLREPQIAGISLSTSRRTERWRLAHTPFVSAHYGRIRKPSWRTSHSGWPWWPLRPPPVILAYAPVPPTTFHVPMPTPGT